MDRKSRLLLDIFFSLLAMSVFVTWVRYMVFKDFEVVETENLEIEQADG